MVNLFPETRKTPYTGLKCERASEYLKLVEVIICRLKENAFFTLRKPFFNSKLQTRVLFGKKSP